MFIAKVLFKKVSGVPRTAIANEFIKKGAVVCNIKNGKVSNKREKFTIQVDRNKHIEGPGAFFHSCNPNCYWDYKNLLLIAKRDIRKDEPISFDYCTTEYKLVNNFPCKCGSSNCYGYIRGFKYLTSEQKKKTQKIISPFLKTIFDKYK